MKNTIAFLAAALLLQTAQAQPSTDPVLVTIAGEKISKSEFERVYRKNNNKDDVNDPAAIREYLELYINYKLKVKEAEEDKLDTSASFITELAGYRKQLAQPYLTDKDVSEKLLQEAYERLKTDINASHVLVKVSQDALPRDTMEAYQRIMIVRDYVLNKTITQQRISEYEAMVRKAFKNDSMVNERTTGIKNLIKMKPGTGQNSFEIAARNISEDPSVKDNAGNLGFFTSMMMVYPFENAAFNTKPGEISLPVRTKYGYHLIKVNSTRPAVGEIHTAHIMIKNASQTDDTASVDAKKRIDEIYSKLKAGEKFEDLAIQYSDDKGSAKNGGVLPWFGTGRMVPEFEKAAFALANDGDFSEPVQTTYGWHIIKRLEKRGIPSFEDKKAELKNQVARDSRSELSKTSMIDRIKKENKFKEIAANKDAFINALDTNLINGEWKAESAAKFNKPLFSIGNETYSQQDFARYIEAQQSKRTGTTAQAIGYGLYENFVSETCLSFEEKNLDNKYPDFKNLMREYRDGILLFDLTDKKVWSKAVKDSAGLEEFYAHNRKNYMWGERADAVVYTCADKAVAAKVRKLLKKNRPADAILEEVNKTSSLNLTIKAAKFSKGDHDVVDSVSWTPGISPDIMKNNQVVFVQIKKIIPPEPKALDEAKGLVTADYQNFLEKNWIEQLRKKYPFTINEEVLNSIGQQ